MVVGATSYGVPFPWLKNPLPVGEGRVREQSVEAISGKVRWCEAPPTSAPTG